MGDRGRFGREVRHGRPWLGADMRIGAVLAVILAFKFGPPMLSARLDKKDGPIAPTLVDSFRKSPPSDALTTVLPNNVSPAVATGDDQPVLTAPVFEVEEKKPSLPGTSSFASFDPPTLPTAIDASVKKPANDAPAKPPRLKSPESPKDDPKKSPPIVFADALIFFADAKATESKKPSNRAGPVHPYFQRYLDQKEYFVRPGDTLESIAHRLFQDEKKAADLLAANKDALPSPAALKPGMTIKLP